MKIFWSSIRRFLPLLLCFHLYQELGAQVFVKDRAALLSESELTELNKDLFILAQKNGPEIAIRIYDSLEVEKESFRQEAHQTFNRLKIGQADQNNGLLILHDLHTRQVAIEVGYGLEDIITDAEADRIIQTILIPRFQKEEYYRAYQEAINEINTIIEKTRAELNLISGEKEFMLDQAQLLSESHFQQLNKKIKAYYQSSGNRVWIRIVEMKGEDQEIEALSRRLFQELQEPQDTSYQTLVFLAVHTEKQKPQEEWDYHLAIQHNWPELVREITDPEDHYAHKARVFNIEDLLVYRLRRQVFSNYAYQGNFKGGLFKVFSFIQKIHRKTVLSSEVKVMNFILQDLLWWFGMIIGIFLLLLVATYYLAKNNIISGGNYNTSQYSSSGSHFSSGSSSNSFGSGYGGSTSSGSGGGSSGGSSYGGGGSFGGGSSGGGGASGEY